MPAAMASKGIVAGRHLKKEPRLKSFSARSLATQETPGGTVLLFPLSSSFAPGPSNPLSELIPVLLKKFNALCKKTTAIQRNVYSAQLGA
jgi:hypothetical protein